MKIHVYIILILLLGISLPFQGVSMGTVHTNIQQEPMIYNFSKQPSGSFPSNGSGFSFLVKNKSNNYRIATESLEYGKGLNIFSKPQDGVVNWTTFEIRFPISGNMSIRLTFNWNSNSNYYETMSNIILNFGKSRILRQYFGYGYGGYDYLDSGNTTRIGADPSMDRNLTIQLSLDSFRTLFYSFGNGSNPYTPVEFPINIENGTDSNYGSFFIGGPFCNITLFSISLENRSSVTSLNNVSGQGWNETSIGGSFSINSSESAFWYDSHTDSIIYENSANDSIYALNLQNRTSWKIFQPEISQSILKSFGLGDFYYCLISEENSTRLISINEDSFSREYVGGTIDTPRASVVFVKNSSDIILSGEGKVFLLSLKTGKALNFTVNGSNITGASFKGSTINFSVFNESSGIKYQYAANISDSSFQMLQEMGASLFPSVALLRTIEGSGLSYSIWNGNGSGGSYVSSSFTGLWHSNFSILPELAMDEGLLAKSLASYLLINGSGITVLPISQGSRLLCSSNGSIFSFNAGRIDVYYRGIYPLPDTNLSVKFNLKEYYSGSSADLNFNVFSSSKYTVKAFINSIPAGIMNSSVVAYPDRLNNGTNYVSLDVENEIGSRVNITTGFVVDDFKPYLGTVQNSSSIKEGSRLEFELNNIPEDKVKGLYNEGFLLNFTGRNYSEDLPANLTGNYSLHLVLFDTYGKIYNLTLQIFIIPLTENDTLTIRNGSYLSSDSVSFGWETLSNVSRYKVEAVSNSSRENVSTDVNNTVLKLGNGEWNITVIGIFPQGQEVLIGNSVINILTYAPSVHITMNRYYVSFSKDSTGSNPLINVTTNTTSDLNIQIYNPGGLRLINSTESEIGKVVFALGNYRNIFSQNGEYKAVISAKGQSGLSNTSEVNFWVNNSIPSFSWLNRIYYTNSSIFTIPFPSSGESFTVSHLNGSENSTFNGSSFQFFGDFTKSWFIINEENKYGSINTTSLEIIYSKVKPDINLSVPSSVGKGKIQFNYSVSDPVSSTVYIYLNSRLEGEYGKDNGTVILSINKDGRYRVYALDTDLCGNSNSSKTAYFNVSSIPVITNVIINVAQVLGFAKISPILEGNDTGSFSYSIFLNSRKVGSNESVFAILTPGYSTISVHVNGDAGDKVYSKNVFSTGPIPEIACPILLIFFVMRRNNRGSKTEKEVLEYIRKNINADIRTMIRNATESGVSRTAVRKLIKRNPGKLLTRQTDPDGNSYVSFQIEMESVVGDNSNIVRQK